MKAVACAIMFTGFNLIPQSEFDKLTNDTKTFAAVLALFCFRWFYLELVFGGMTLPRYFVWLPTQTGPQPQIWHDEPTTGEGKPKFQPLAQHLLKQHEEDFTINQLASIYPAPE